MEFQLVCKILENFLMFFISGTNGPKNCPKRLSIIPTLWFGLGVFVLFSMEINFLERESKIMNVKKKLSKLEVTVI